MLDRQGPLGKTELSNRSIRPLSIDHVFLISDFLVPENQWKDWFKRVKLIAKESSCFHLIDPEEEHPIPHEEVQDIENVSEYRYLAPSDWQEYRAKFQEHRYKLRYSCLQQNITYQVIRMDQPIGESIRKVLSSQKMESGIS